MGRLAVEIVLRDKESFANEIKRIKDKFSSVDSINIPDLAGYDFGSWDGSELVKPYFQHVIPHFRALYIDKYRPLPFAETLKKNGVSEVLIIAGDPPTEKNKNEPVYWCSTIDIIKKFKKELPKVKVYAGVDQYRGDFYSEMRYVKEKIDAGADGFFTQPFFDLQFMELYAKYLKGSEIFWGVCPIASKSSQRYWVKRNKVIFPPEFEPTIEWSREFTRKALKFIHSIDKSHAYFMPIIVDVEEYLTGII